jgi:very-short-patch-repair endonuclease
MRKIDSFKSQELSNTAYAIGILGLKSSDLADGFWKSLTTESMRNIDSFNAQDLSNTAYAVGILGLKSSDLADGFWKSISAGAVGRIDSFNAQDLSNTAYAIGILGLKSSDLADGFWKSLTIEAMGKIGSFKSQELSNTAYAVSILGLKSSDLANGFWKAISARSMKKIGSYNPQGLSNTAYGVGILGLCSSDLADGFWKSISSRLEYFSTSSATTDAQDISNFLYGAALSSFAASSPVIDSETVLALGKIVISNKSKITLLGAGQLLQSFVWFDLEIPDAIRKALPTNNASDITTSRLQQRVSHNIRKQHQDEYWIDELAVPVDICVPDEQHVIQVDGPSHFDQYGELKIADKFATALLEKSGWKVTRIRYDEVDKLKSDRELEEWLDEKLK